MAFAVGRDAHLFYYKKRKIYWYSEEKPFNSKLILVSRFKYF